ncbi:hypothetical protein PMAYCL1PPCAC_02143 [Pristionchus mayeri]|uniref:Spermidine synthase n=1 Tax=Pristionchus mayeri TaxID=1317129 RepID=A0AAN4Z4U3_9BILA|nr:hypothetical protein PMAYCL1PPCAC_02143 [Pristionchus mayeri]
MFLHIRRSRLLAILCALLLSMGALSFWISHSRKSHDGTLPTFERIDQICTARKTKCFQVVDRVIPSSDEEEIVTRSLELLLPSGSTFTESVVRIRPVKHNATFADSDTRLWRVDGDELGEDYSRGMAILPFLTRVFRLGRRKEHKKIAFIGGGAALLAHLSALRDGIEAIVVEKEKEVAELSKRWFEVGDAPVIVEDGVEWMRQEGNASQFDIVFIDACERQAAQQCPVPPFTKEENVRNLHRMLNNDSRGQTIRSVTYVGEIFNDQLIHSALVVINFEIYNSHKWEMLHQQMGVLLSIFPHCVSIDLKERVNMIVGCLTRPLPFYSTENPLASLDASMGFIVEQYSESMQELQYGRIFKEIAVHAIIEGKKQSIVHPADKET